MDEEREPRRIQSSESLKKYLKEIAKLPEKDEILHIDLSGRDPDDGSTDVPYEKGALFLRQLEGIYGRDRLDRFLRGYFDHFAFQSIPTDEFVRYLRANLLDGDPGLAAQVPVEEWIEKPGIPASAPISSTNSRVMPGSRPASRGGVNAKPSLTMNRFVCVPSASSPR